MNFNEHWTLQGKHAFLSPSQYYWINDDKEKLGVRYSNFKAKERGIRLHELASMCIKEGVRLARNKTSLNMFVNDAIGYKMESEQVLYYSDNCYGTTDAISFRKDKATGRYLLRIHDLKTGTVPAHMMQLMVYASLFCLEYDYSPYDIDIELRIYQTSEPDILIPEPSEIQSVMDVIVDHDRYLNELRASE